MRRKVTNRNIAQADARYNSEIVGKFINYMMWSGKRVAAEKAIYSAFDIIKEKTKSEPLEVFDNALKNAAPMIEVRSRRIGGANYQVPREVRPDRRNALAMRWIKEAARSKKGVPIAQKLAEEIILASNNEGTAVKKKQDTHKMAEANKAFAHFTW